MVNETGGRSSQGVGILAVDGAWGLGLWTSGRGSGIYSQGHVGTNQEQVFTRKEYVATFQELGSEKCGRG